jgi:hypothetical protein
MIAAGVALVVAWSTGWWRWTAATRWCQVRYGGPVVSVVWGDAAGQQQFRNWEMAATTWLERSPFSALPPASPASFEEWRPRLPQRSWEHWTSDEARLPSRVVVVRFPVWPAMLGLLLLGSALVWTAAQRGPGERRVALGVVLASS